ncbi:Hypothetical predicted protein [Paramuricea clavata]|uniref:Uncharacterized protein n=1 Tax=Paramuricea clavata TaxID=317549 RepID=A0A7D9ILB5_PARCT|nr:Hypothetical predicted protein [Paramuricea clavata]
MQFPQFSFATSGTVDVWGCEQDMILPCLRPILSNSVRSFCDSPHCPQDEKVLQRSSMLIVNGGLERLEGQTYLELMLAAWLHPPPELCGAEFHQNPPPAAKTRQIEPWVLISETDVTESDYCGGTRPFESKEFDRGPPWVLPIFLGNLAQTKNLKDPEELPSHLHLLDCRYSLGGLTFWTRVHYNGRLFYRGKWYDYDGMHRNPLSDIQHASVPAPVGFILTSCLF